MEDMKVLAVVAKPARRIRIGVRGLLGLVLVTGVGLGWFARQDRLARLQSARVNELRRMGVVVNHYHPTLTCFIAMRFLGGSSARVEGKLVRWLDPGWFSRPEGFNAGYLPSDQVDAVVERIARFGGDVKEVRFQGWGSPELCLFYLGRVPYENLGVPREKVTVIDHPKPGPNERGGLP